MKMAKRVAHYFSLAVLALVFFVSPPVLAAGCQPDGSSVIEGLPPELGAIVAQDIPKQEKCVAPSVKDESPPVKTQNKTFYQGPVVAVQGEHVLDEIVVSLRGGESELEQLATDYGLTIRSFKIMAVLGGVVVRFGIPDGRPVALVRASLDRDPLVIKAVPNHIYQLNGDGQKLDRYSLKSSGVLKAHSLAQGRGVKLAIIDTAVDEEHPALVGAVVAKFNALKKTPLNDTTHGTAIALLAAGAKEPFMGAAPEATLFVARAFDKTKDDKTISSVFSVLDSLNWALEQDVDVVNMSFSGPKNELLGDALENLLALNMVLVAAAGNQGKGAPFSYPAAQKGVFAVTALDAKNRIYNQANQGPYIYVSAPGVDLLVPEKGQNISFKTGTSYGAALFSGICALALEGRGKIGLSKLKKSIEASVEDLGRPGRDHVFGYGLIKAGEFVRQAQAQP